MLNCWLIVFFSTICLYCLGCETGKYDTSCSKTCSHCMNNETCDIDTGECDYNGCALPGFESPLCSGKLFKRMCGHLVHLGIKKLMIIKVVYLCSKLAKTVVKKQNKKNRQSLHFV